MRDYSELVKALRTCKLSIPCTECPFYSNGDKQSKECATMNDAAADAIEELLAVVPKWISVEERLPGDCEHVLCRIEEECMYYDATGGEVFAMDSYLCEAHYRRGKYKGWYKAVSPDISSCTNNVTHWMPLPDPPKEDAK